MGRTNEIPRLHLKRTHDDSFRCHKCWKYFTTKDETQEHQKDCRKQGVRRPRRHWMTNQEKETISARLSQYDPESWHFIYQTLLPDVPSEHPRAHDKVSPCKSKPVVCFFESSPAKTPADMGPSARTSSDLAAPYETSQEVLLVAPEQPVTSASQVAALAMRQGAGR